MTLAEKARLSAQVSCPICAAATGFRCRSWDCERVHVAVERKRLGYHPERLAIAMVAQGAVRREVRRDAG